MFGAFLNKSQHPAEVPHDRDLVPQERLAASGEGEMEEVEEEVMQTERELLDLKTADGKEFKVYYDPDYKRKCCSCSATPCVRICHEDGKVFYDGDMCGACTWGEAAAIDPANW